MKKIIVLLLFVSIVFTVNSQGLFKPVSLFPSSAENAKLLKAGEAPITNKWAWRFDATQVFAEVNRNTLTKESFTTAFSAIGPAIGYQHFVPTSALDPTPLNNYGVSLGIAVGESIFNPELTKLKLTLAGNLWEYFKFGLTYTPKPLQDIHPIGYFFGGGVTF